MFLCDWESATWFVLHSDNTTVIEFKTPMMQNWLPTTTGSATAFDNLGKPLLHHLVQCFQRLQHEYKLFLVKSKSQGTIIVKHLIKYKTSALCRYSGSMSNAHIHLRVSDHLNIVSVLNKLHIESILNPHEPYNVFFKLEYAECGDLAFQIRQGHYLGRTGLIKKIMGQLMQAVKFCHQQGIYHRNICPKNILCANNCTEIRLTGFSNATSLEETSENLVGNRYTSSPGENY